MERWFVRSEVEGSAGLVVLHQEVQDADPLSFLPVVGGLKLESALWCHNSESSLGILAAFTACNSE